jgi:prolyl oligopeptidase
MRYLPLACASLLLPLMAQGFDYPAAPRGKTVDNYHGTQVADPYRWLEDVDAPQTRAWVAAQNQLSLPFLAALPEREALHARLTDLWNYERYGVPQRIAGKLFYTRNDGLQNQPVLYVQEDADAAPRVLLDPNTLAADGTVALTQWEVSPDGRWLAYGLAAAGSDWNEFRVREIASGRDQPQVLERIKFSGISWSRDAQGFFYSRYPQPPKKAQPGVFDDLANQKLYYHRLGTPQSADTLVYERPDQPKWGFGAEASEDGRYLFIHVWQGASSQNALYVKPLGEGEAPDFSAPVIKLVDEFSAQYQVVGNVGPRLFVQTTRDAPRGQIVVMDLAAAEPAVPQALISQSDETLVGATHAGNQLVTLSLKDASHRLRRYGLDGKALKAVKLPGLGSITGFSGKPGDDTVYFGYASFNQPASNYQLDLRRGKVSPLQPLKLRFNPADYVTEQVFYRSKDGTRVPMFISYKKKPRRKGPAPTLLYGYGGFDISLTPGFSVSNLVWMEAGGIYAQANLRGGGEYGREWHEAGTKERKQNVFDDFAAAAQYLIAQGWTRPEQLAISGRSNGGLLVGATLNQHPELFAAALPAVGVMDMLRFHKFTIGWAWTGDYGSSDDPEGFRYLSAYSPYHNIRPGTRYPAVLVTTADHDDRVVPGHSYKYAAALQHAQAGEAPVLIRVDVKAGHGAGKPLSKAIDEAADALAFIRHYTTRPAAQAPSAD